MIAAGAAGTASLSALAAEISLEELELIEAAITRRDARRQLAEMVNANRAFSGEADSWDERQGQLLEAGMTGLTKIEPPARDANAKPPRPKPFQRKKPK